MALTLPILLYRQVASVIISPGYLGTFEQNLCLRAGIRLRKGILPIYRLIANANQIQ